MNHRYAFALVLVLSLADNVPGLAAEPTLLYSHGNPTDLEQNMLELINRARMNPTAEGVFLDTLDTPYSRSTRVNKPEFFTNLRQEFARYPAGQPLAFNTHLTAAARNHAADMVARNYFAHVTPEGHAPWDRTAAAGYPSQTVGENIDGQGMTTAAETLQSHFGLMVDAYNISQATHPLGHRLNVLNTRHSEIGIGAAGDHSDGKIVQDFGDNGQIFIVGVVYRDANHNQFYDPGEGLANLTVKPSLGRYYAVTSTSGGYAIPLEPFETRTESVPLSVPAGGGWTDAVQQKDDEFRAAYRAANSVPMSLTLTVSGEEVAGSVAQQIAFTKPIRVDYTLNGTDGWYFPQTMYVGQSVKVDFSPSDTPPVAELRVALRSAANGVLLSWTGGKPPYRIQKKTAMNDVNWQDTGISMNDQAIMLAIGSAAGFFRVTSAP